MKVLWLSPEPPIAPYTGGRERAQQMLAYLARAHAVHLLTFAAPEDCAALQAWRRALAGVTPIPYPRSPRRPSEAMREAARELMRRFRPDAIHVQGLDLWPYAAGYRDARRILELYDLPSVLQARWMAVQPGGLARLVQRLHWVALCRREAAAVREAAITVVTSQPDHATLSRRPGLDGSVVRVVPNGVDSAYWAHLAPEPDPMTLLFPAALNWPPNVDAARMLVEAVLPQVRAQLPRARVVLAGRLPDASLHALAHANPQVEVQADPADMRPFLARATLMVVPLRAASGTRLKILQALAASRPVLTTPIGVEGLGLHAGCPVHVASLIVPFVEAVVELMTRPAEREALARAGYAAVDGHAWQNVLPALGRVYPDLSRDR